MGILSIFKKEMGKGAEMTKVKKKKKERSEPNKVLEEIAKSTVRKTKEEEEKDDKELDKTLSAVAGWAQKEGKKLNEKLPGALEKTPSALKLVLNWVSKDVKEEALNEFVKEYIDPDLNTTLDEVYSTFCSKHN